MDRPPWGSYSFTLSGKQQLVACPSFACPLGAIELQQRELYWREGRATGDCRLPGADDDLAGWGPEGVTSLLLSAAKGAGSCQKTTTV